MERGQSMEELFIEADVDNMDAVLDFVGSRLEDCHPKVRNQIAMAVDEVFSNIARYAYCPKRGGAKVRIAVDDDITVEFEDSGVPYNPLFAEAPDTSLSAEEREVGGLGIFMVKNIMDSVEYRRDGNKNILTVKKKT